MDEPGIKLQLSKAKAAFKLCQIIRALRSSSGTSDGNPAVNTCTVKRAAEH